jgi:hypothetical protein
MDTGSLHTGGRRGRPRQAEAKRRATHKIREAATLDADLDRPGVTPTPTPQDDRRVLRNRFPQKAQRAGAWAELIACAWLIEKEFEVYRNVVSHGACDLVFRIGNRFFGVDVKLVQVDYRNKFIPSILSTAKLTDEQREIGVLMLLVTHDGVCAFDKGTLQAIHRTAADEARKKLDPDKI